MDKRYESIVDGDILSRTMRAINDYGPSLTEIAQALGARRSDTEQYITQHPDLARLYKAWVERVKDAIVALNGNRTLIAHHFHTELSTLKIWESQNASIKQAFYDADEAIADLAEQGLVSYLVRQDPWAIQFVLTTKARHRGYVKGDRSTLDKEAERLNLQWQRVRDQLADKIVNQLTDAGEETDEDE